MSNLLKLFVVLSALSMGIGGIANSAQPPDIVASDANNNTAMGTGALQNLSANTDDNTAAGLYSLQNNLTGLGNSAFGSFTLWLNSTGRFNSALGFSALASNTTGGNNIAMGVSALQSNTTGGNNTGLGTNALVGNQSGNDNTAIGFQALNDNTTANNNVAVGSNTLFSTTTGSDNVAVGFEALHFNTTGFDNVAVGNQALFASTTAQDNVAIGTNALRNVTSGSYNMAVGYSSCWLCKSGTTNVAYGFKTLYSNTGGSNNTALGAMAGFNLTRSNNIDIGNQGLASDSGIIRIGTPDSQGATYIAGITGTPITGAAVYVSAGGQLGVLASSERFKTSITTMGSNADRVAKLRPVTFHLKAEPHGVLQYGLIAEEVNEVYPELVIRDSAGRIQGVRYDELAPILLKELQQERQERKLREQAMMGAIRNEQQAMRRQIEALIQDNETLRATMLQLQNDRRVAMR